MNEATEEFVRRVNKLRFKTKEEMYDKIKKVMEEVSEKYNMVPIVERATGKNSRSHYFNVIFVEPSKVPESAKDIESIAELFLQ